MQLALLTEVNELSTLCHPHPAIFASSFQRSIGVGDCERVIPMRYRIAYLALATALVATGNGLSIGHAASGDQAQSRLETGSLGLGKFTPPPDAPTRKGLELVVFEQPKCRVCEGFRERVAPAYEEHETSEKAPLKYVDIVASPVGQAGLARELTTLPTVVLMKDGKELARVEGLFAAPDYMKLIDRMFETAGE
jgi:hypothetical protein